MPVACLYLVATPIGNLEDLSTRARRILGEVDLIAAEDTRHSRKLLQHCGITTPMTALHDHNESEASTSLVERMLAGDCIALISDAGTPLVSDPGYKLVAATRAAGVEVVAIPGPSAALAALCVSGLPSDRFVFEGFLPARSTARRARLRELAGETRTLIFFESCHRIVDCVEAMLAELGAARRLCIARELTKLHEESHTAPLSEQLSWLQTEANRRRGEFVLVLEGNPEVQGSDLDVDSLLRALLAELPAGKAARVAASLTSQSRSDLYERIQQLKAD